jgi:beta-glucosidase/6-phospho-beta-glucosidase/beta-galactosidase
MRRLRSFAPLATLALLLPVGLLGCGDDESTAGAPTPPAPIAFGAYGSTSTPAGKGSFRFGVASAATQIEDQNPTTDWWVWSGAEPEGLGKGKDFVGDASMGFSKAVEDVALLEALHVDSYRFSMEWARIEPTRDVIDEAALTHYGEQLDALIAKGIQPMVTVHHFSNPIWVDDPRDKACAAGPGDANLCGWNHAEGGPLAVAEIAQHAKLLAERFGDRIDDWCTLNEPINYLLGAYGVGTFPPGKSTIADPLGKLLPTLRNYIAAHVAVYDAIKQYDTVDADGDGVAASVGFTHGAQEWVPSRDNQPSEDPEDIAAVDNLKWVYQYLFVESVLQGKFDTDLDQALDEDHPEWKGKLDWLGVQYYFRAGVTGKNGLLPVLALTPCYGTFDVGSCVPPLDPSYYVPSMAYEHDPNGLYLVLSDFAQRWPDLPLTVSESGVATTVEKRRGDVIVRALEAIAKAQGEGADVRGYYHWSLYDNFEWAEGYGPRFGLYRVDYASYARTGGEAVTLLGDIAQSRGLSSAQRATYGGSGPLSAETEGL